MLHSPFTQWLCTVYAYLYLMLNPKDIFNVVKLIPIEGKIPFCKEIVDKDTIITYSFNVIWSRIVVD